MTQTFWETLILLQLASVVCILPGLFLVLRRQAMLPDAVGHVLLPGIVLAYFICKDLKSDFLKVGAFGAALLACLLIERIQQVRYMRAETSIALVFPGMFALGVLLVSLYLKNTHLDIDRVLLGFPEFAIRQRISLDGYQLPAGIFWLLVLLIVQFGSFFLFWRYWQVSTFDAEHAQLSGLKPRLFHYGLMVLTCLTGVLVFDATGPILLVGFFVTPVATGLILARKLAWVLIIALLTGLLASTGGLFLSHGWDLPIPGTVSTLLGVLVGISIPVRLFLKRWSTRWN